MNGSLILVGGVADDPFAIDVAHYLGQQSEIADLIAYKTFANSEFCPRFIVAEDDLDHIGQGLRGKTVIIVSTCCGEHTRNARAMRTFLIARAAKDNGAECVVLIEPDLFFSAQDRGPQATHGQTDFVRTIADRKKFDGQPFSSRLYAQLLHVSGVDRVITVHNHSVSVERLFRAEFGEGTFLNLKPSDLYADYLMRHTVMEPRPEDRGFVVCAPDQGAVPFVREVQERLLARAETLLIAPRPSLLFMEKERASERRVEIRVRADSPTRPEDIRDRDVVVIDDMVRTGTTIVECCRCLKAWGARRVIFMVTHFHSSQEVKENLNDPAIDEIVTTNCLPAILNRDMQGRLRRKMLVLKIEKWIADTLRSAILGEPPRHTPPYTVDVSSKNPLWKLMGDLRE